MTEMPENWRYIIPLRDGSFTPGTKEVSSTSKLIDKIDMAGKEVLDVGAWDGHYSLIAAQKGAKLVTALDIMSRATIQFIKEHYELDNMEIVQGSIYHFDPQKQYDVVLFYGVYYHLSDPVQALINCFRLSKDIVAVEGVMHKDKLPTMLLLDPGEIAPMDTSNIFSLSTTMLKKLGRSCGFHAMFEEDRSTDPRFRLGGRGTIVFKRDTYTENAYADWSFPVAPLAPISQSQPD